MPESKTGTRKLNLGCGDNKIEGYINVDINKTFKPDLILDFCSRPLPYEDNSVDEIVIFHTIEHIPKQKHEFLIHNINKVLKQGGRFIVSYPEFLKCVKNYESNYLGKRDFWEATIYGRQSSPFDFHVCIMDTDRFARVLADFGFGSIEAGPEELEPYNTLLRCEKVFSVTSKDELFKKEVFAQ
jgi:SAM-dependent methyltransferase